MINKFKGIIIVTMFITGCVMVGIGNKSYVNRNLIDNASYAKTAVMITSPDHRSGGTGVILDSHPGVSHILTNKHVCELIQVGGLVITDDNEEYLVDSYKIYPKHDLCRITVEANLNVNIKVADKAPLNYETSVVVGHPHLLPTMITIGHFSQKRVINLIVGIKPCDGTENNEDAIACIFLGGKPIVKSFIAQSTSSLIMPGSSGSAVFNSKGELSGLIFAGEQGLSYGFLVPWEYVNDFLRHQSKYKEEIPNASQEKRNFFTSYFKFEKVCYEENFGIMSKICKSTKNLGLWSE